MSDTLEKIKAFTEPLLEGTDIFIVNIKIKPTNNIKLFLDSDTGLSVDKSVRVNRKLYHLIEESGMFPDGDFSLEVSSPGVDEPLGSWRQYKKNVGRTVLVTNNENAEQTGVLKEVSEEKIVLEVKIPKKKETQIVEIPFSDIKSTVVQIIF
ncbi:ribosome maturation factor RimP [Taibaiella soli]|uniref:Ribosome maturation factor RimP n=1 Tax=Taibaiella soli TaxID=1649169 RepID=A0A2W2BK95_9BACT|nr:ribosome maturation factor [Taibaiella soli]PZF73886.1 ribosome maturation factor [Taibaiella soli]